MGYQKLVLRARQIPEQGLTEAHRIALAQAAGALAAQARAIVRIAEETKDPGVVTIAGKMIALSSEIEEKIK